MSLLNVVKLVSTLPASMQPDTIYLVRVGTGFDLYTTDSTGTIAHSQNFDATKADKTQIAVYNNATTTTAPNLFLTSDNVLQRSTYDVVTALNAKADKSQIQVYSNTTTTTAPNLYITPSNILQRSTYPIGTILGTKADKTQIEVYNNTTAAFYSNLYIDANNVINRSTKDIGADLNLKADKTALGTAAAKNVGEASDNVMQVGAFGLGSTCVAISQDLNTLTSVNGMYMGADLPNKPANHNSFLWDYVTNLRHNTSWGTQHCVNFKGRYSIRVQNNGAWQPWGTVYTSNETLAYNTTNSSAYANVIVMPSGELQRSTKDIGAELDAIRQRLTKAGIP